jgi:two-component system, LytTR family, response regulator
MKKKYRAIIVDDERLARKDLKSLLADYPSIEIVGEADNVSSALRLIEEKSPNLLFLDIQMPGETGFDLLEKIDQPVQIIFVTAFDEYAIQAFEVDAIDYLLKPVNPDRMKKTIERLGHPDDTQLATKRRLDINDTMFLTVNTHPRFVRISSIICIQSAGDYVEIVTSDGKKGLVQKSMTEWEERLPENYFCRIHRSTIINLEHIVRIEEWFNNAYRVYLRNIETPVEMSRRYAVKIKNKLG